MAGWVFDALNPLEYQAVFGQIMTVLIALEFNHTLQYVVSREQSIIQTKIVLLIGLLALSRQVHHLGFKEATPNELLGLAATNRASDQARVDQAPHKREQEFDIGGYIPGARGFDALLVGVYENKELQFVAKVKNGFVPRIRDDLFPALKALQTAQCLSGICPRKGPRGGENR